MDTTTIEYKRAFEQYMRKGIPIALSLKQARTTTHYIWRTRHDGKVRASHAANDGKIFAWDNPPPTGHPGEDYGCRCTAEPYTPAVSERFDLTFQNVLDTGTRWRSSDFVSHYLFGNGQTVTVRQTGSLSAIVEKYRRIVIDDPKRLPAQIADVARANINRSFYDDFNSSYDMQDVVFSIGDTKIEGEFVGFNQELNGILHISGSVNFMLRDEFRDPLDIKEFFSKPLPQIINRVFKYVPNYRQNWITHWRIFRNWPKKLRTAWLQRLAMLTVNYVIIFTRSLCGSCSGEKTWYLA